MSTPGDDDGELRIGGWVPPTHRTDSPDEAQVTQVIPAVGAEQRRGRHSSALVVQDNGGIPVDDRARRVRRTAATVAVSVVFLAIAAGIPVMLAAFDEPSPPDNRVLPAPSLPAPPSVRVFPAPSAATTSKAPPSARPTTPASRAASRTASRPPRSAPPRQAAATTLVIEAEGEGADRDGFAAGRRVSSASGGTVISRIGHRFSTLTFKGVTVPRAGTYDVVVSYVTDDDRRADIEVNGRDAGRFDFPGTGSDETVKTMTVRLPLAAGPNTIEFGNPDGWAPDLDRIALTF